MRAEACVAVDHRAMSEIRAMPDGADVSRTETTASPSWSKAGARAPMTRNRIVISLRRRAAPDRGR
ncbi:hypothetical protein VQ03_05045 [Methylobacterium tarhaniae]|uniref:Uncharacterized protein n=1 Tax=Methylobacterium tarhaniae TaxID=1187852 RepID=A0A0J6VXT5_9HYPH|nr:hypothetical protein [Methylobacterium tarhaniae]KMO44121.1 hypothetical protein VQ03_05045 [Methylobacterium tarhaniae]